MVGFDRVGPGLHTRSLQQSFGLLVARAQRKVVGQHKGPVGRPERDREKETRQLLCGVGGLSGAGRHH